MGLNNYKYLVSHVITASFLNNGNVNDIANADDNGDGILRSGEFNELSNREKRRIRNYLEREGRWDQFVEQRHISYERREAGQAEATQRARGEQQDHRTTIESGSELLSANRLQSAVNYLNRMDADRRNAIGNLIPGRQADTRELALAVAVFQSENGLTVDGKPGNNTVRALNAAFGRGSRTEEAPAAAESRETPAMRIVYPPQGREATKALQRLIGTPDDGAFGPGSRRQLQIFLREGGFYSGPIDGDIGRGSRRAIELYNNNLGAGSWVERERRNFFQVLGDFFRNGRNRPNLDGIDNYIDATDRDLHALDEQITNAVASGDEAQINTAYRAAMTQLRGRVPDELYQAMSRARTRNQKNRVLDFISNALMGGRRTVEIAQGARSPREYAANLSNLTNATRDVLQSEGFSQGFVNATLAQMEVARGQILNARSIVNTGYSQSVAAFSVRTRGGNRQLQAFSRGTTESISIDGVRTWEVPDASVDIDTFIDNMSNVQLEDIGRELQVRNLTKEQLKEFVEEGKVTIDAKMILAHNCWNVGYELDFENNIPERERDGRGTSDGDAVGTGPGIWDPNPNPWNGTSF